MSDRPRGMDHLHAAGKHDIARAYANGRRGESVGKDTKTGLDKVESDASRSARAEEIVRSKESSPASTDHLLAELEGVNEQIEDAEEDGNKEQADLAKSRKAIIEALLRDRRDTPEKRDKGLAERHASLRPAKEYMSPLVAYRDAVQRYMSLHETISGAPTPATQRISRDLESRMEQLLPGIAKDEIAADLRMLSVEQYRKTLEAKLSKIESSTEERDGNSNEASENVERNLLKEKLRQLEGVQPKSIDRASSEQKKEMSTLRAKITRNANQIIKLEQERKSSWNPMKRWNLAIAVRDLEEDRVANMKHLRSLEELHAEWQKAAK